MSRARKSLVRAMILLGASAGSLFCVNPVHAAQIIANSPAHIGVGDSFMLTIALDTDTERINAIEGSIRYPKELLTLRELRDGNSIINLWVERPVSTDPGTVRFAGMTPGGFQGDNGEVFTLVFEALQEGTVRMVLAGGVAYKNTGDGIAHPLSSRLPSFVIAREGNNVSIVALEDTDTISPESFTPIITTDSSLFDGNAFVAFTTQDKGSGIDHYEVAERKIFSLALLQKTVWQRATSPHILQDQSLSSYVYVKAIDKAGNERVSKLSPSRPFNGFSWPALVAILLVFISLLGVWYVRKNRSQKIW